jgi:hypothetical protein
MRFERPREIGHLDWHPLANAYSEAIPTKEALQLLATPDPLYGLLEREWDLSQQLELPHWPGRHDSLMIWRRPEPRVA